MAHPLRSQESALGALVVVDEIPALPTAPEDDLPALGARQLDALLVREDRLLTGDTYW